MAFWRCSGHADWSGEHMPVELLRGEECLICRHGYEEWKAKTGLVAAGTDLMVITHPCPRCHGVDKILCFRCDGSGRVSSRTRDEQVAEFLREERLRITGNVQAAMEFGRVDQGVDMASCCGQPRVVPDVDACYDCARRCEVCSGPSVDGRCPNCRASITAGPPKVYSAKNRSGTKARDVQITMMGSPGAVGFPMDAAESLRSRLR